MSTKALIIAPAFGPAVITFLGLDVPVLATTLSIVALLMAKSVAPPPVRKLTSRQHLSLTILLIIFTICATTGELPYIGDGEPLGVGMAVAWGAGLGLTGLLAMEMVSQRFLDRFGFALDIILGKIPEAVKAPPRSADASVPRSGQSRDIEAEPPPSEQSSSPDRRAPDA